MGFYNGQEGSLFAWLFSISGIMTVGFIALIVWLIFRFMNNRKENEPKEEEKKWDEGYAEETSFWESNTEELKVEEKVEFVPIGDGLYEKDCTKMVIEEDVLFDDVVATEIPADEEIKIYKKDEE